MDWWPAEKCDWGNCSWIGSSVNDLNFEDNLLIKAASELNGILRVGGTLSDQVIYRLNSREDKCQPHFTLKNTTGIIFINYVLYIIYYSGDSSRIYIVKDKHHQWTDGCVTRQRIDKLINFVEEAQIQMVFNLAALWGGRTNTTTWKYDNAEQLLNHIVSNKKSYIFYGFELGNELYGIHGHYTQIPPEIAAKDFKRLRKILGEINPDNKWKIIGTDTALDIKWTKEFFSYGSDLVDIFTWHEYPLGSGGSSDVADKIMNPETNRKVRKRARTYQRQNALPKGMKLWMGETGGAYGSGKNEVTNRFISSFWYLDWLGIFAQENHSGFCRQTLIGGNYGLLQNQGIPIKHVIEN